MLQHFESHIENPVRHRCLHQLHKLRMTKIEVKA